MKHFLSLVNYKSFFAILLHKVISGFLYFFSTANVLKVVGPMAHLNCHIKYFVNIIAVEQFDKSIRSNIF